jgi:hypothetical protein
MTRLESVCPVSQSLKQRVLRLRVFRGVLVGGATVYRDDRVR